jgi:hypothetical protein
MADRSPELAALDVLVGEWTIRVDPPEEWGVTDLPDARCTFEWALGGAYLVQRSQAPGPVPDAMAVFAVDGDGYLQHYFDSRGVTRLYRMTLDDGVWRMQRTEPDFSPLDFAQRFVGTISPDGRTIDARWEVSHDGGAQWELDFALTYTR